MGCIYSNFLQNRVILVTDEFAYPTGQPEGRHYWCRVSCGGFVVLVDEAAEPVVTANFA